MTNFIKKYNYEILFAFLCLALGMVSGLSVKPSTSTWYLTLIKPSFNPPGWIFGPVWSLLYVMMGIAFGIILRDRKKNMLLIMLFIDQFFFNLLWSPLFFYFNRIDLALVDIVFLWISIISFIFFARKQLILMLLFLPYSIWASFAMILNFNLFILNP